MPELFQKTVTVREYSVARRLYHLDRGVDGRVVGALGSRFEDRKIKRF
jgi:hypothetical protein